MFEITLDSTVVDMYGHKIIVDGTEHIHSILMRIKNMFTSCKDLNTINISHFDGIERHQVISATDVDCTGAMCTIINVINAK